MSDRYQSLSHARWHCKDHVVFVPKRRRKTLYGSIRKALGPIFHALARQKACRIIEGHVMADHVHMCIEIPPKHAVASMIGFLKGKSAIAIARQFGGRERNFTGEHFWARGYAVSTVGFELDQVRAYMRSVRHSCKKLHPPTHARVVNNGLMSNGTGGAFMSTRY
jgi:putative transposase